MKKILTTLIIFCFYTQSITTFTHGHIFNLSYTNPPSSDEVEDDGKEELASFKYRGEQASGSSDGWLLAWEQVVLLMLTFSITTRVARCLEPPNASQEFATKGSRESVKCFGLSHVLEISAGLAILIGEIVQSVSVQDAIKESLGELVGEGLEEHTAEKIVDDIMHQEENGVGMQFVAEEVRKHAATCDAKDDSGAGIEDDVCENQVRPLKILKNILEAQLSALEGKRTLYWVAFGAFGLNAIVELIGWMLAGAEKLREVAEDVTTKLTVKTVLTGSPEPATKVLATKCSGAIKAYDVALMNFAMAEESINMSITTEVACSSYPAYVAASQAAQRAEEVYIGACVEFAPLLPKRLGKRAAKEGLPVADFAIIDCGQTFKFPYKNKTPVKEFFYTSIFGAVSYASGERKSNSSHTLQVWRFWSSIIVALGGPIAALALAKSMASFVNRFSFSYTTRATWSAAEMGLVALNLAASDSLLNRLKTNLDELNKFIDINETSLAPSLALETDTKIRVLNDTGAGFENQFLENFNETFADEKSPCPFGADGKGRGGCLSAESVNRDLSGLLGLDGIVAETASNAAKFGDGIANKNKLSKNVLSLGRKITAAKGPLGKIRKKLLKKINEQEVALGRKPVDIDKEAEKILQNLKQKVQEVAAKNNLKLASIGDSKKIKKPLLPNQAKKKSLGKQVQDDSAVATESGGFEFSFQNNKKEDGLAGELADDSGVDVDQYDVGDADITTGKTKNIFQLITTRYFKSAYPVLVEEAK